jgi:hypothetical protein
MVCQATRRLKPKEAMKCMSVKERLRQLGWHSLNAPQAQLHATWPSISVLCKNMYVVGMGPKEIVQAKQLADGT